MILELCSLNSSGLWTRPQQTLIALMQLRNDYAKLLARKDDVRGECVLTSGKAAAVGLKKSMCRGAAHKGQEL
jgi:hypothetical protein